jgi:hypothetical protein
VTAKTSKPNRLGRRNDYVDSWIRIAYVGRLETAYGGTRVHQMEFQQMTSKNMIRLWFDLWES